MKQEFSHLNKNDQPKMVDVGSKNVTVRRATAKADMFLGQQLIKMFENKELRTAKGPVFQTAIIAGIQAVKKTPELIPMCHPLMIDGVDLNVEIKDNENIEIICTVKVEGKTGVEMEALTGASVAALTVYDMCKSVSKEMRIEQVKLVEKTGGKSDFKNEKAS